MSTEIEYLQVAAILAKMKWWQRAIPLYNAWCTMRTKVKIIQPRTAEMAERLWRETGLPWELSRQVTEFFNLRAGWWVFPIYPADEILVLTGAFLASYSQRFCDGTISVKLLMELVTKMEMVFEKKIPTPEMGIRTVSELVSFLHTVWGENAATGG